METRRSWARAFLVLLAALSGCGRGALVVLLIDIDPDTVSDDQVAAIRRLDLAASGAEAYQTSFAITNQLATRSARITYRPSVSVGRLDFVVQVSSEPLTPIGRGSASGVALGGTAAIPVHILVTAASDGPPQDMGGDGSEGDGTGADQTPADLAADDAGIDAALPDLVQPDLAMPDLARQDFSTPDLATPDLARPDLSTPDLTPADLWRPALPPATFAPAVYYDWSLVDTRQPLSMIIGDLDGDSFGDLVVSMNPFDTVKVAWGNSAGAYPSVTQFMPGYAYCAYEVVAGDFNGDGRLDLAVPEFTADWGPTKVQILMNGGNRTFTSTHFSLNRGTFNASEFISRGDFNRDGKDDLVVSAPSLEGHDPLILHGQGNGSFQVDGYYSHVGDPASAGFSRSINKADFNGDNKADLAVVTSRYLRILLANGDGTFRLGADTASEALYSAAVGDFNADGRMDLAVTTVNASEARVFMGNGDGTFQPPVNYAVGAGSESSIAAGDLNSDGKADLAVANSTDNTVSVLLNSGNGTFQPKVDYAVGRKPLSVAIARLNSDASADLAVVNSTDNTVSVLLNSGSGTFQPKVDYATGGSPQSVIAYNLNGDSFADLAVTNTTDSTVSVLLANGDGTLRPKVDYATGTGPRAVAGSDLNNDGRADLIITELGGVSLLFGSGAGAFQARVKYSTGSTGLGSVVADDFNGNSWSDLAVLNSSNYSVQTLLNAGGGTFRVPFAEWPRMVNGVADFNGDGASDVMTSQGVMLNNGDGTFRAPVGAGFGIYSAAGLFADFNNDGKIDVLGIPALLSTGDGTFTPASSGGAAGGAAFADFNRDGKLDIATCGGGNVLIWLGYGDGAFAAPITSTSSSPGSFAAAGDLNGDGKPDIACLTLFPNPGGVSIILNTTP